MATKKEPVMTMGKLAKKLASLQIKSDKISAEIKLLSAEVQKAANVSTPTLIPTTAKKAPVKAVTKKTVAKKAPPATKKAK